VHMYFLKLNFLLGLLADHKQSLNAMYSGTGIPRNLMYGGCLAVDIPLLNWLTTPIIIHTLTLTMS